MKLRIKNTALTLKVIGWLQVAGGISGLMLIAYLMLNTGEITGGLLLIFLIGLALFVFSINTGKRMLTDENKTTAIILSIINQVLQLFQWNILGYGISYSSGAEVLVGIQTPLTFKVNFTALVSTFKMNINNGGDFYFKVNLFAILVTVVLVEIINELKPRQEAESQVLTPGEGAVPDETITPSGKAEDQSKQTDSPHQSL